MVQVEHGIFSPLHCIMASATSAGNCAEKRAQSMCFVVLRGALAKAALHGDLCTAVTKLSSPSFGNVRALSHSVPRISPSLVCPTLFPFCRWIIWSAFYRAPWRWAITRALQARRGTSISSSLGVSWTPAFRQTTVFRRFRLASSIFGTLVSLGLLYLLWVA